MNITLKVSDQQQESSDKKKGKQWLKRFRNPETIKFIFQIGIFLYHLIEKFLD